MQLAILSLVVLLFTGVVFWWTCDIVAGPYGNVYVSCTWVNRALGR